MDLELLRDALALSYIKGIGPKTAKLLIQHLETPTHVLHTTAKELIKIPEIGEITARTIIQEKGAAQEKALKEIAYIEKENIACYYLFDEKYPLLLKELNNPPLVLFSKGNISFESQRMISIVGTRNCTNYGKGFIQELLKDLTLYKPIIISGLAYGCDIQAHEAALKNGLSTIGVLAHGLNQLYPSSHKKTAVQMMENGGLITEFSSFETPIRENFIQRNRIIAGLSKATLLIESADKGGAMVTAYNAFENNREVFALPGKNTDTFSKGCNTLIKKNIAQLITSAEDIITALNWSINEPKSIQTQLFQPLLPEEEPIYQYLISKGKTNIDQLTIELKIPMQNLSSILLMMELKGLIRALPAKQFEAI